LEGYVYVHALLGVYFGANAAAGKIEIRILQVIIA